MLQDPDTSLPHFIGDAIYRQFFEGSRDEMYLHDRHGRLIAVNQAACSNLGYCCQELVGMHLGELSAELPPDQLASFWNKQLPGQHVVVSNRHRRKDGSSYPLDVHLTCQSCQDHTYFLAVGRPTEDFQRQAEKILQLNTQLQALVEERTKLWRESSHLLNAVMEQTPDIIFIKDCQGRYQYANGALARQLGMAVEDILGRTDFDLYPFQQARLHHSTDLEVLRCNAVRTYEDRMDMQQRQDGKHSYANTMKTPYKDETGTVIGILGISRDVSDVRHAQNEVAHNYEMLRQAERIAKVGSWTLNLHTNTFTSSEMLCQMNGLKPGDPPLTPESLACMIPAEQHARLSAAIQRCVREGISYTVDVEHKRPEGGSFPARIRGQAYRDSDGKITMLHGTLQDLSELVEADLRLQTLADNLPNGAIFRCEQTKEDKLFLRYVSAGIQQLVGVNADLFIHDQKAFTAMLHAEDVQAFFECLQISQHQGTAFDLVSRVRHVEGHYRWLRARAVPRSFHHGTVWEGILLDVTTEYEAQQSLRLAKETAEAAEKAKSEFLATMSHEIRTPMNTVIGMTQLLQQTALSDTQRNYLDKINLSANALLKIINDTLDFSKLEAEMLHIDPVDFQLDALLESVATVTGLQAEQKGVEIVYSIAPDVPRHLHGDVQRLSQILTNLVSNAVKFTDHGEIVISMHVQAPNREASPRDCRLHVSVRDTGIGIHPEHMALLFQPFTQAEAHISRRFGGTGLGLSIAHKLVHLMGGEIQVDSEPGRGSTFSFHVQLQAQNHQVSPKNLLTPGQRVLVVDDNQMAREILSSMVSGFGLECTMASNGRDALQELHAANHIHQPYQLVLMDWQMPGMDGLALAEHIRSDQSLSTTPAMLMVSALSRDEVAERVAQLQLQGLLIKPITESTLFNAMQDALQLDSKDGLHIRQVSPGTRLQTPEIMAGRRILVVDDNALNREVAQDLLKLAGVEVTTASSGPQALSIMAQKPFDAVLLDVQMPVMDGLEVARHIRQNPQWKELPVWALTAQARLEERHAILQSGMHGHLTKPINAQVLYSTLAQAFSQTPRHASAAPVSVMYPPQTSGIAQILEGQQERMQRLLRAFVRDFETSPQDMLQLFAQQDWKALGTLAHTLKGSLGYLDQPCAMQAMDNLDWACKHEAVTQATADAAAQHLRRVLLHICRQLDTMPSAPTASCSGLDAQQMLILLGQAIPLIQRGDYAGMHVLEQLESGLRGSPLHALAARALVLAEDLENAAACACLQELRGELHTKVPTSQ